MQGLICANGPAACDGPRGRGLSLHASHSADGGKPAYRWCSEVFLLCVPTTGPPAHPHFHRCHRCPPSRRLWLKTPSPARLQAPREPELLRSGPSGLVFRGTCGGSINRGLCSKRHSAASAMKIAPLKEVRWGLAASRLVCASVEEVLGVVLFGAPCLCSCDWCRLLVVPDLAFRSCPFLIGRLAIVLLSDCCGRSTGLASCEEY